MLIRKYETYSAYVRHQISKGAQPAMQRRLAEMRAERMETLLAELAAVKCHVPAGASGVCLGARAGEEVEVLSRLGYRVIGIDLLPLSPLVRRGDFHQMEFEDGQFDFAYCNSVDHVLYPQRFAHEVDRVLKRPGWIILRIGLGMYGRYESLRVDTVEEVVAWFCGWELVDRWERGEGTSRRINLVLRKERNET